MTVFDRTDVELAISHHKLPEGALYSSGVTACYASELSATIIVSGAMEYTPGKIVLSVERHLWKASKKFSAKRSLSIIRRRMETLKSKPAVGTEAIFEQDKTVWVRDESSTTTILVAVAGKGGYSYPACIHCGQVQFTDASLRANVTGTVALSVVIGRRWESAKNFSATNASVWLGPDSNQRRQELEI